MSLNLAFDTHQSLINALDQKIRSALTIQGKSRSLRVVDVHMPSLQHEQDFKAQKVAKMEGISYFSPVFATLELLDGQKVIEKKKVKLFDLPQITRRGTYIVGGNEYHFPLQKRLIPGIYTSERQDGTIQSWLNSKKGQNFEVTLRDKGDFILSVQKKGTINLLAFLRGMGVPDQECRAVWGDEVFNTNSSIPAANRPVEALKSFFDNTYYPGDPSPNKMELPDLRAWIINYFENKSEFDPENVKISLGKPYSKIEIATFLDATRRILEISRGEKDEDNKESLIHNQIVDLSDFMVERISQSQYAQKINRTIKRGLDDLSKTKISQIYSQDLLQTPVESTFTQTSLSKMPKQNNFMDTLASFSELTVMGEGGISSLHQVTRDVRALDPSHFAFIDPAHTPEGENIGTTLHLASTVKKQGRDLVQIFRDVKTKEIVRLNPRQVFSSYVTFPEYWDKKAASLKPDDSDGLVKAMHRGEIVRVSPKEIQYALLESTQVLGFNTIAVPFVSHNNGTRVMTAAKMQSQAKPLKYREAPLVQSAFSANSDRTLEDIAGINSLTKAPATGTIIKASDGVFTVRDETGQDHSVQYVQKMWMNENNYENEIPIVKVGDKVTKGQHLTDSNNTKDGKLALGINLRVAYVPYKGLNHEDGVVISETASKKLTSLHAYQYSIGFTDQDVLDKKKFMAFFPSTFNQDQASKVGDNGVIKVGQKVVKGDPLVLKMKKIEEDTLSRKLTNISRLLSQDYRDVSEIWGKSVEGTIAEVHVRKKDVLIVIETEEEARVGDKLVGRYGNKGTITSILADKEMPHDEEGNHMEILLDPTGTPGRMNIGQILETTASRIAEKTGKPYIARPFGGDHTKKLNETELAANGLKDHVTLVDGEDKIEGVLAGKQYILKLEQQVEKKMSARGAGVGYAYTVDGQPSRGDGESGRAIGLGELYALLSHGANTNLSEMYTFKGDKQLEVWRAVENGTFLPAPEMPASSERFVNMLRAAGVDLVEDEKNMVRMTPFLDKDVRKYSNGVINDATVLRAKDLKEESGGLYDLKTTGGISGDKWAHIELAEPIPHPTFEFGILAVTGLKKQEFEDIISGKSGVLKGKVVSTEEHPEAKSGGNGIKELLSKINVENRIEEIKEESRGKKGSDLNKLYREARILKNFKDNNIKLEEMIVETMPIMPPKFRPIIEMGDGGINVADVNEHYRAAILMNNHLKTYKGRPGLREEANKVRKDLFEGMRGVMGLSTGLVTKPDIKGIAEQIAGTSPKYGYYHSKLLKRRQETSGTAVVGPGPELDMDTLGVPEGMAWKVFEPFVIGELKSNGLTKIRAEDEIQNRTPFARDALLRVMDQKLVMMNRAPTLHKASIMAFKPRLIPGSSIKVPIEVLGGFNMDFDGDTVGIHVPTSPEAAREAQKMLPSQNLYQSGYSREKLMQSLGREYMLGVFKLGRAGKQTDKFYETADQAINDANARRIMWNDMISVRNMGRTTAGRIKLNSVLPPDLRDYNAEFTEKYQTKILSECAKLGGEEFKKIIGAWKNFGRLFVYTSGTSFLVSDLNSLSALSKRLYAAADIQAQRVRMNPKLSAEQKKNEIIKIYSEVDKNIKGQSINLPDNKAGKSNNIADMVASGMSKPGPDQLKQLVGTVGLMLDHRQQIIAEPVRGNYADGLDTGEFFQHMYAQRKGMIDKSRSVSGPGMLSKEITNSATLQKVTVSDCGTRNGKMLNADRACLDRCLAEPTAGYPANTVVTTDVLSKIQALKIQKVKIRSVLTCEAPNGVCAHCYGLADNGSFPPIGANVGLNEIQAITERSVQLPMKSFHTGGVASAEKGTASAFDRALNVFRMPSNLPNKATLSEVSGKVASIRQSGYGGWVVNIAGKDHKIGKGLEPTVKLGDDVMKGDKISTGLVKPDELLNLKGIDATQDQITEDLHSAFASAGIKFNRRTHEVAARMLTEQVRIKDAGDSDEFVVGDFATIQKVNAWNKAHSTKKQIKYDTILPGSLMAPMASDDWARRMALSRITQTIEEGASMGFKSDRKKGIFADLVLGPGTKIKKPGEKRIK